MNIVCLSYGKDSAAMVLRMIEINQLVETHLGSRFIPYPIDKILYGDTEHEYPDHEKYIIRFNKILKEKGYTVKVVKAEKPFEYWFYGKVTRGKNKGKVRGFPLLAYSCYLMRESKVYALQREYSKTDNVYIGIAYDEKERMSKTNKNIHYPLIEWGWTEKMCADYLNKKGLLNPLYVNFNRLGCWFCPKQSKMSLYILWKNYPDLWKKYIWWDNETMRECGRWIRDWSLTSLQISFEKGWIPTKGHPKYKCSEGCEGVKNAFKERQCSLNDY